MKIQHPFSQIVDTYADAVRSVYAAARARGIDEPYVTITARSKHQTSVETHPGDRTQVTLDQVRVSAIPYDRRSIARYAASFGRPELALCAYIASPAGSIRVGVQSDLHAPRDVCALPITGTAAAISLSELAAGEAVTHKRFDEVRSELMSHPCTMTEHELTNCIALGNRRDDQAVLFMATALDVPALIADGRFYAYAHRTSVAVRYIETARRHLAREGLISLERRSVYVDPALVEALATSPMKCDGTIGGLADPVRCFHVDLVNQILLPA